jgi:hypothetical protein
MDRDEFAALAEPAFGLPMSFADGDRLPGRHV